VSKKLVAPTPSAPPDPSPDPPTPIPAADTQPGDRVFPYADFVRARAALEHAVTTSSYNLVLGQSGTGKTLLLRLVKASLDHRYQPVYMVGEARLSPSALARVLALAVHLPLPRTHVEAVRALGQLLRARLPGSRLVVLVDEAQRLHDDALDALRLLAEIELDSPPLFSVVLAGPPELRERFEAVDLFAFKRRLTVRVELTGLRADECRPFLARRLGEDRSARFREDALGLVFERGRGIPALVELAALAVLERVSPTGPVTKQVAADALDSWEGP
jgi:type II secretory pathway predicted ATPase ExeA